LQSDVRTGAEYFHTVSPVAAAHKAAGVYIKYKMADGDSGPMARMCESCRIPRASGNREGVPAVAPTCDGVPIWNLLTWRCEFQDNTPARTSWGSCITELNLDPDELGPG